MLDALYVKWYNKPIIHIAKEAVKMGKRIPLSRGKYATVDQSDYVWLSQWKWSYLSKGYAVRMDYSAVPRRLIYMHRQIMDAPEGVEVDHINRKKLDNQRANLRLATRSENARNQNKQKRTLSMFKGVYWRDHANRWQCCIYVHRKQIHLGYFDNEEEAARAYDTAARLHFGEFAKTNF
mgnify:FL=1